MKCFGEVTSEVAPECKEQKMYRMLYKIKVYI